MFVKILPEMYLWTSEFPLNFGSHLPLDESFEVFLSVARLDIYHNLARISGSRSGISWQWFTLFVCCGFICVCLKKLD